MKKFGVIIMMGILSLTLVGCFKRDNFEDIDIYTTAYPIEYITDFLYGEHSTIHSIYPNGVNISTYKLTEKQIKDYSKSSLFVFNGLSKEKDYVIPMVEQNTNLKIIDTSLTMEFEHGIEELWLNPSNFLMLTQNIRNGLKEYINNHYLKNDINDKYDELKVKISEIDAELKLMAESSDNKTIVVASDIFQFLEKYNFNVISLEENENLTEKKIIDVENMIYKGDIDYIFLPDNMEETNTIKMIKANTNVEIAKLYTLSNLTEEQITAKKDYLSIMNENIESLKNELYD